MPQHSFYAALILPDATNLDPQAYLTAARRAIIRHDTSADSEPRLDSAALTVCGDSLCLSIEPQTDSDYGPRILFTASAAPGARFSTERAARVLSQAILVSLKVSNADIVEWFTPDTLFEAEEFVRLRSYVSPHRGSSDLSEPDAAEDDNTPNTAPSPRRKRTPMHPPATGNDNLAEMFHEPMSQLIALEPQSQLTDRLLARCEALRSTDTAALRMNAANWAMTGTVACISPPMGASMTVLGLARGLDFRRVTQALTLTALFVLMQQQGLIGQFAEMVIH